MAKNDPELGSLPCHSFSRMFAHVEPEVDDRCGCCSSDTVVGGTQRPSVHLNYSPPDFVVAISLFPHNFTYTYVCVCV